MPYGVIGVWRKNKGAKLASKQTHSDTHKLYSSLLLLQLHSHIANILALAALNMWLTNCIELLF